MTEKSIEEFAKAFKVKFDESDYRFYAQLARDSKTSKQNISRILNLRRHPDSGAMPTVTRETVIKWATFLNWDEDEALELAGFSSLKVERTKPAIIYEIESTLARLPDHRREDILVIAQTFLKREKLVNPFPLENEANATGDGITIEELKKKLDEEKGDLRINK